MPRKSPIHYIYPSAISVTPNANDSENDLAVTVIGGAKIKVYSPKSGISMSGGVYQEWSFTGRNRRLSQSGSPYTIYARLAKSDKSKGYLVFAPKDERDGKWYDKYCYVTPDGIFPQLSASHPEGCRVVDNVNWWIRLGDVSLPEGGKRTVSFDTGILGTDEFNTEWAVSPDSMPMRIEIGCVIDDEDAGPTPYVYWDKMLNLTATLVEGWTGTDIERFDHWEISRNTGDAAADAAWPSAERATLFAHTGRMTLSHERGALDDFNSAVATTFTVTAWGRPDDSQEPGTELVPMKEASIVILAETVEKYEVVLSSSVVSYNPSSDTYRPEDGIVVNVRATDQRGNVYRLGRGQIDAARIVARYAHVDTESWSTLQFADSPEGVAEAVIPVAAFAAQKNVNVRLENADGKELDSRVVSFLRDGEDSREREWIFFRSKEPVVFGDASSEHPLPSLISGGEVEPDGAASGEDTNKNQDGWVPQGWWDEQHGTDDEYRYEYSSYRDYVRSGDSEGEGGHWGDFTKPNTWSYYGEDAVSYRCKWLLDGVEVWQLVSSYTGAFRGTLPLVATLMKRKGSGSEEPVAATDTVITVIFEGLDTSYTEAASSPQFTISEVDHPEMVSYLNDARLTNILIVFETREETFSYSIPIIKEADEDSIIQTMEEHGSELFLSKTSDDTANGFITFAKGFLSLVDVVVRGAITAGEGVMNTVRSSNYTGDGIADTGFRLTSDDGTGSSALTVDNLHVRKKATFEELEVKKETAVAGNEVRSAAANVINRTDYYDENGNLLGYSYRQVPWLLKKMPFLLRHKFFGRLRKIRIELSPEDATQIARIRCYFLAKDDDRDVMNLWKADNINGHDLVRCQTFNLNSSRRYTYINGESEKIGNVFWWRKAIAVSSSPVTIDGQEYHYVDVSMSECAANSDIPAAGDHMVQFGNDSNSQRMNLIIQEINGTDAPAIKAYTGIYTFDINKCWWGGSPRKMMLSPTQGYEFYGPSFRFVQEYGVKPAAIDRGAWSEIATERDDYGQHAQVRKCYYYDKVTHKGCYWLCVFTPSGNGAHWVDANGNYLTQAQYDALTEEQKATCSRKEDYTTAEPGTNDAVWQKQVDRGTSVKSVKSYYAKTNRALVMPRDDQEVTWEESLSALGEITEGWYVWTKNITTYSDTLEDTTTYTVSKWGIDGDGIENIETKFYEDSQLLTQQQLAALAEDKWKEYNQLSLTQGDYIYTRTRITYNKGDQPTVSYQINRIGQDGVGYVGTEEYYVLGNSQTNVPSGHPYTGSDPYKKYTAAEWHQIQITGGWSENRPTYQGDDKKYLWNFEVSFDTDGNALVTKPICIGNYAKGIDSIVETYAISAHDVAPSAGSYPSDITKWTDEAHDCAPTDEKPYQWNKTVTTYTDGTSDTFYHVSAVKGTKGTSITKASADTFRYAIGDSGITPPTSGWSSTKPSSFDKNKWLWTETTIHWSDNSTTVLYSAERNPNDGKPGQDIIVDGSTEMKYYVGDSNTTHPAEDSSDWKDLSQVTQTQGKWLWSKATTWYRKASSAAGSKDAGHSVNYNVSYISKDGKTGRGIQSITEYYQATNSSAARQKPTSESGWDTDPNLSHLTDKWDANHKYLWNMEKTVYTNVDGSTTTEYSIPQILAIWTKDGNPGRGIDSIQNKYCVTSSSTAPAKEGQSGAPTWYNTPQTPGKGQYLWNYEIITWVNGTPAKTETDVQMIGYAGTNGRTPEKGRDYNDGADAWSVAASPSPLIINQNIDNASDFGLPIEINFTGKCGDNTATVGTVTNIRNSMGLGITAGSGKITITSYSKVDDAYVTSGVIVCTVPLSYGSRSTNFEFRISVGVNMIGQFSDEIKGDMRTELANSTLYKIEDGVLIETENWGEFYRSSTENFSKITKQVNGLITSTSEIKQTADDIKMSVNSGFRNFILNPKAVDAEIGVGEMSEENDVVMGRVMYVSNSGTGDFQLICRFDDDNRTLLNNQKVVCYMVVKPLSSSGTICFGIWSATHHNSGMLRATYNGGVISVHSDDVGEATTGAVPVGNGWYICWSSFNAGTIFSEVKQSNGINSVNGTEWDVYGYGILVGEGCPSLEAILTNTGLRSTGIDILDGNIVAKADNFEIQNSSGSKTFSIDADGNLQASGGAKFKGSIITEGKAGTGQGNIPTRWEITPLNNGIIGIPQITGFDTNGNPVLWLNFDGDLGDSFSVPDGGGMYFNNGGGHTFLSSRYARQAWRVNCHNYGEEDTTTHQLKGTYIEATTFDKAGCRILFINKIVDGDAAGQTKNLIIGADNYGAQLVSDNWPTSTTTTGRVYKDDWGYLKVKDTKTYDRFNVKTSDFTLPDDPPIGTMFFVKRVLNDITIKTGNAYVLNGSNNGTLWEPNKTYNWDDTHSMVLFYLGEVGATKYWTMIYSS